MKSIKYPLPARLSKSKRLYDGITGRRPVVKLQDGSVANLSFQGDTLTRIDITDRRGKASNTFRMQMRAADGGTQTCWFCREDSEARASICYQIPCSWILGVRTTKTLAEQPAQSITKVSMISANDVETAIASGTKTVTLQGGDVIRLVTNSEGIVSEVMGTDAQKRKLLTLSMRMQAADGGAGDKCMACVCNGDGGCKCVEVPCPKKP